MLIEQYVATEHLQWHCRGHEFDPHWLHHLKQGVSVQALTPF